MNKKGMISRFIGAFVAILIGVSMLPVVSKQVTEASSAMVNDSSPTATWGSTMLKMTPAFFALAILGIGIAMVTGALRSAGLLGGRRRSNYEEPTGEEIKIKEKRDKAEEMEKKYHYDFAGELTESKSGLQMSEEDYTEKKNNYEERMKKFRETKKLSEKEMAEKNDYN